MRLERTLEPDPLESSSANGLPLIFVELSRDELKSGLISWESEERRRGVAVVTIFGREGEKGKGGGGREEVVVAV